MSRLYGVFRTMVKENVVWVFCLAGAVVPLTAFAMKTRYQYKLMKEDYYSEAVLLFNNYPPAREWLGDTYQLLPIVRPGSTSKTKFETDEVTLDIPVRGPKDDGYLTVKASKVDGGWTVDQMDIELNKKNKAWTFYKNEKSTAEKNQDGGNDGTF